jgi:hypothetical protein
MDSIPAGQPAPTPHRPATRRPAGEVADLVARLRALEDPRAARLARARRLLLSGGLDQPEVLRETARRLLDPDSGS